MWCWVQVLQDHEMVINVIDAVVAGTEKFLEVKVHVKK